MQKTKPEVEIEYCKRIVPPYGYYFNVFTRSVKKPSYLLCIQIERGGDEREEIGIAAGAMAEQLGEKFNEDRNPDTAARAAMDAYDRLNALNPIPRLGEG